MLINTQLSTGPRFGLGLRWLSVSTTNWTLLCIAACTKKLLSCTWSTVAHQIRKSPAVNYYAQPVDNTLQFRVIGWTRYDAGPTLWNSLSDRLR